MHNTSENRRFRTVSIPIMTVYRFFEKISSFHDLDFKQGVEKRASRFSLIGDAEKYCARGGFFGACPKGAVDLKWAYYEKYAGGRL